MAKAAEAAATAAAHAVEAAKAAEAASRDREANGDGTAAAAADAARQAAGAAREANANAERAAEMAAASSEPTVLDSPSEPGDEAQEPQTKKVDQSQTAGTDDGVETADSTTSLDGEDAGDLLGLDSPTASTPRVLARLGLLAVLGAAGIFVLSVLAVSLVAKGTVLDVIVLITWLGVAGLSIAGVLLLAAAGILRVVESSRTGRKPTEELGVDAP